MYVRRLYDLAVRADVLDGAPNLLGLNAVRFILDDPSGARDDLELVFLDVDAGLEECAVRAAHDVAYLRRAHREDVPAQDRGEGRRLKAGRRGARRVVEEYRELLVTSSDRRRR